MGEGGIDPMAEHWVELAVNEGLFFAKVEIVRLNVSAWGLSFPRLGVVTGVGPSGAPSLTRLSFAFFRVGGIAVDLGRGKRQGPSRIVLSPGGVSFFGFFSFL